MWDLLLANPLIFFVTFGGLLLSLSFHEFFHAFVADKLGDPTPRMQGRLTLNPLAHLDPLGVVALLLVRIGWGKPVQFDPYNLKNPRRDAALIAIAGPLSNLFLAGVLTFLTHLIPAQLDWLIFSLAQIVIINIVLAVFNLVPVHPLDGSKILTALLPVDAAIEFETVMHRYGMIILLALILPWYQGNSPISYLIAPVVDFATKVLFGG